MKLRSNTTMHKPQPIIGRLGYCVAEWLFM